MTRPDNERAHLLEFLAQVIRPGSSLDDIDEDTNLVTAGVMDSLVVIEIILYLEREHGIDIRAAGIDPADLMSISGVLKSIERSG